MIYLCFIVLYLISGLFLMTLAEISSPVYDSCRAQFYSCENPLKTTFCGCDILCKYYDDCCFNSDRLSEEKTEVTKLKISLIEQSTCECTSFKEKRGAFMVSSCPGSWKGDIDVKYKCEQAPEKDYLELIPVFDPETNVTFKNRQCALCHNVHGWIPWLLKFRCGVKFDRDNNQSTLLSFKDEMKLKMSSDSCKYLFEPSNDMKARSCDYFLEYLSLKVWTDVNSTACRNRALAPLWVYNMKEFATKIYRNIQCFIDDIGVTYLDEWVIRCYPPQSKTQSDDLLQTIDSLIDMSTFFSSDGSTLQCSETEIHLSQKIGCKTLYCPSNMEPFGGRCNAVTYKTNGITLDLLFETNNDLQAIDIIKQLIASLMNESKTVFFSERIDITRNGDVNIIPGYNITSREPCFMVQVRYLLKKTPNLGPTFDYQKSLVKTFISNYQYNFSNSVHIRHVNHVLESVCTCNVSLKNPSYAINPFLDDTSLPCPAVKVHLHENYSDNCYDHCSESNGTILQQYFYLSGQRINSADVLSKFGNYFLCVDTFISKYNVVKENDANLVHHLSVVNTMLSYVPIICLLYFLVL